MEAAVLSVFFGLFAGVRHAMEPDHLAAVSTLVATRRGPRQSFAYAAAWGLGHAAMILVVGVVLYALKASMPLRLAVIFELGVGAMLVVLGIRSLVAARRAPSEHVHPSGDARGMRPLLVGTMHGLAGSGALVAIAMAKAETMLAGLGFLLVYAVGAMMGMAMLAGAAGLPLARLARHPRGASVLLGVTGALCVVMGLGCLPMLRLLF